MGAVVFQKDFVINDPYGSINFDLRYLAPGVYTLRIPHWYEEKEAIGQFVIYR
jgi:hypothetical protein